MLRKIIHIDEQKCNGCGLCVPACAEGAIQVIDGKAHLIDEKFCDGLGACLGECPQGAIMIEEREAPGFDEQATAEHLHKAATPTRPHETPFSGCPGAAVSSFQRQSPATTMAAVGASGLGQWPIQLHLVPPTAPFLKQADLLICADCVPFAYANFHQDFLQGKALVIGCPKLDDLYAYQQKLTQIIRVAGIKSITVLHMEVPCCYGLVQAVNQALLAAGRDIPLKEQVIGVKGDKR